MLGIRLSGEDEQRFARFARQLGRPKSVLARDWLLERLERESIDAEFDRQIQVLASSPQSEEDRAWHHAATQNMLAALDEEDGGYDRNAPK